MKLPLRCRRVDYTVIIALMVGGICAEAKPAGENAADGSTQPRTVVSSDLSRRLIASRTDDGFWSANARLPTAVHSGNNNHSRTITDLTGGRTTGADDSDKGRHHRRLTKWEKTADDSIEGGGSGPNEGASIMTNDEGSLLYQSLKAMETHLLDSKPEDELLNNSSEKDVYLDGTGAGGAGGGGETTAEQSDSDEEEEDVGGDEDDDKGNFVNDGHSATEGYDITKEKSDMMMNAMKLQQLKLQHQQHQTTTPKGLTTWSAVGVQPPRGTVQKVSDFTVSSAVAFSTVGTTKPITNADILTKDKMTEMTTIPTTTTMPMTTMAPTTTPPVRTTRPKKRPVHNKKPTKYVKPALDEVKATQIGSDETHNVYVLKPANDPETKTATPDLMESYTKQPWPFMTTKRSPFMKIRTTARPIKNAYAKRTQTPKLSLTTPMTTTKPSTSTVYYRNPSQGFVHPVIPVSFSNLSLMDYLRTQIVPKMGLSIISFIATSPLFLTMLGAVGRKKRDLSAVNGRSAAAQNWKFLEGLDTLASKWDHRATEPKSFKRKLKNGSSKNSQL